MIRAKNPRRILVLLLTPILFVNTFTSPTLAQESQPVSRDWPLQYNGLALLCRSLEMQVEPGASQWYKQPPEKRLLIMLGLVSPRRRQLIDSFVEKGGAVLIAADSCNINFAFDSNDPRLGSISIIPQGLTTLVRADQFLGMADCPVVRDFSGHPVVEGLELIATNRPGGITSIGSRPESWRPLANFPDSVDDTREQGFLWTYQNENGGRILFCSDESVFNNQMLYQMDNARLLLQALNWLSEGSHNHVLIRVDDEVVNPPNPTYQEVNLPDLTPEQVRRAISSLPPEMMLQVGNEVAAVMEDENLINEFLEMPFENVSKRHLFRGLLLTFTSCLVALLLFRYMRSETTLQDVAGTETSDTGSKKRGWFGRRRKAASERHTVARELVGRFYARATEGRYHHYVGFPAGLELVNCENEKEVLAGMRETGKSLKWKSRRWWTQTRLQELQTKINFWEHLLENEKLACSETGQPGHT